MNRSEEGDTPYWLIENVLPHLGPESERKPPSTMAWDVREFIGSGAIPDPQFWGWYADYDWVVFCWLQGRMIDLPRGWPMYCRDLKQVVDQLGVKIPKAITTTLREALANPEHNALADARELKARFEWVQNWLGPDQALEIKAAHDSPSDYLTVLA